MCNFYELLGVDVGLDSAEGLQMSFVWDEF